MSASSARSKPLGTADAPRLATGAHPGLALDSSRLIAAAERHQKQIWYAVGLLIVSLLVAWGVYARNQRRLAADNVVLAAAFALLDGRVDSDRGVAPAGDEATPGDSQAEALADEEEALAKAGAARPHFATAHERTSAAHDAFAAAIDTLGTRSLRTLAEMMAANLEVELDRADEARQRFELLVERLSAEETLGALARMRLAYVLEGQDKRRDALEVLQPLTDEQRSHFADEAGLMRARLLAALGDVQLARMALEQVRSRSTNQALAEEARIALAALNDDAPAPEPSDAAGAPDPTASPKAAGQSSP